MKKRQLFRYSGPVAVNKEILHLEATALRRQVYEYKEIEGLMAKRFRGNFYGLLHELGVTPADFIPALHLNKLTSPYDYNADMVVIKLPIVPAFTRM